MSDGMTEGLRAEEGARAAEERMSKFGGEKCFYCGGKVENPHPERFSFEDHRHSEWWWTRHPENINFCSRQCSDWHRKALEAVRLVAKTVGNEALSPAVRVSLMKMMQSAERAVKRPVG